MMKKIILMICVLCIVFSAACDRNVKNNIIKEEVQIDNKQMNEKKTERIINDKSVDALNPIVIDEGNKEKNVIETEGALDYGIFGDIDTLSETAEEIVGGTVQKVTYDEIEGMAWMKVDVLISDVLKGELKQNDVISVYMLGGYISLEEHIKYHDDAFRYNMTKKEIKKAVIKEVIDGEAYPKEGEKNVFYLCKTSSDSPLPSNAYERIRGKYAELDVVKEHEKVKRCTPENDGATKETYTWKEIKKKAKKYQ